MKYKIKIPEDGDLKWDDVGTCESLTVAKSMDGNEVEVEGNPKFHKWATIICYGIERRFPWGWLEEVEGSTSEAWVWAHFPGKCDFSIYDMSEAFNAGVEYARKERDSDN